MPPRHTKSREEYQFLIQDLKFQVTAKTDVLNQLEYSLNTMRRSSTEQAMPTAKTHKASKCRQNDISEMIAWLELHQGLWLSLKQERQAMLDKLYRQYETDLTQPEAKTEGESDDSHVHSLLSSFSSTLDGSTETNRKASLLLAEKLRALSGSTLLEPGASAAYHDLRSTISSDDAMYGISETELQGVIHELKLLQSANDSLRHSVAETSLAQVNPDFASAMDRFNKIYQSVSEAQQSSPASLQPNRCDELPAAAALSTEKSKYRPSYIKASNPDMQTVAETVELMAQMQLTLDRKPTTDDAEALSQPPPVLPSLLLVHTESTFTPPQSISSDALSVPKVYIEHEDPFQEIDTDSIAPIDEEASETNSIYSGSLSSSASFSDHSPSGSASPVALNFSAHHELTPPPLPLKPSKISARYLNALHASTASKREPTSHKALEELGSLRRVSALKETLGSAVEKSLTASCMSKAETKCALPSKPALGSRDGMKTAGSPSVLGQLSESNAPTSRPESNPFEDADLNPFEELDRFEESSPFREPEVEEYFDFHVLESENPFIQEPREQIAWPLVDSQQLQICLVGIASYTLEALIQSEELNFTKGDLALASLNSFELGDFDDGSVDASKPLWALLSQGHAAGWALGISVKMTPVSEAEVCFDLRGQGWFPTNYIRWLPRAKTETEILVHIKSQRVVKPGVRFLSLMTGEWLWLSPDAFEWIDSPVEPIEEKPGSIVYLESIEPRLFSPTADSSQSRVHDAWLRDWSLQPVRVEYSVGSDAQMIKLLKSQLDAAHELVATECRYLNNLLVAKEIFADRLHPSTLSDHCLILEDWTLFFGHMDALLNLHRSLLLEWTGQTEDRVEFIFNIPFELIELGKLGALFVKHCSRMQVYVDYCRTQMLAIQRLGELRVSHPHFQSFLKDCVAKEPRCRQLDLGSYLLEPMQRITRYPLLLRQLLHYTEKRQGPLLKRSKGNLMDAPIKIGAELQPDAHYIDPEALELALESAEQILKTANEAASEQENALKMTSLSKRLSGQGGLEGMGLIGETRFLGPRRFLREGSLRKAKSGRRLTGYLFNDFLLLVHREARKLGKGEQHGEDTAPLVVYRKPLLLNEMIVRDLSSSQSRASASTKKPGSDNESLMCFQIVHAGEILTLMTPSAAEKRQWLGALSEACQKALTAERKRPLQRGSSLYRSRDPASSLLVRI